MSTSVLG